MVVWSEYYRFSAEDVEAIEASDSNSDTHPFKLTVYLKSGKSLSVIYVDKRTRQAAIIDLSRQIDSEKRMDSEKIHNSLYILRNAVNRIDKRQLRIWKQLKALLGIKVEDDLNG